MAGKASIPAPIDRPLSRAYLREFGGWSTAYPPGASDPNTLRDMNNCYVTREGALAVRPGLRPVLLMGGNLFSSSTVPAYLHVGKQYDFMRGSFESFYGTDGVRTLLFATARYAPPELGGASANRFNLLAARYYPGTKRFHIAPAPSVGYPQTWAPSLSDGLQMASRVHSRMPAYVRHLQVDNKILSTPSEFDPGSSTNTPAQLLTHVGEQRVTKVAEKAYHTPNLSSGIWVRFPNTPLILAGGVPTLPPGAAMPMYATEKNPTDPGDLQDGTLLCAAKFCDFTIGYFYTLSNEFGETPPSKMQVIRARRPPSQWLMKKPNADGTPSDVDVTDPNLACDQFVIQLPVPAPFPNESAGLKINVYSCWWSSQAPIPTEGVKIAELPIQGVNTRVLLAHTPLMLDYGTTHPIPNAVDRTNYSVPPHSQQGLVVGDRLVLVGNRDDAALVRWSSNRAGEYFNFSPALGGGYKTLASGNSQRPIAVKLWQNPQSVDTITILCDGEDGGSTAWYMSPAEVTGMTGATSIMGFEETTATPGTVAAFGCEVVNQALYHPLEHQLMKSTAQNYNINHKSMTDDISNRWVRLRNKSKIVSATLDNRIYYIVDNPDGPTVENGCRGNEIWVLDVAGPNPTWARWNIQAHSLKKLKVEDRVYMSVIRPEGIYLLDEDQDHDLMLTDRATGGLSLTSIEWSARTNTQGANRAHDAWAHVQQVTALFGSFTGKVRYGIRGVDIHGQKIDKSKIFHDMRSHSDARNRPWDIEDQLQIKHDLKEWEFYVGSVTENGIVQSSFGSLVLVQYRYTPVSVNAQGEFGSVETFEYTRRTPHTSATTSAPYPLGVPAPYIDTGR